jgi:hypothetical protein
MLEEKLDFNLQICDTVSVHNILSKEFDLTSKANSPIYNENQRSLFDFSYQKLEDALQAIYQENPTIFSIECPIKDDQIFYIESECIHLKHDLLTAQNTKVTHDYILSELAKTDSMITTLLGDPRAKSEIWGN